MERQHLLETAFSDIPSKIGDIELRRLSAGSFTLLSRLGNPMMVGERKPVDAAAEGTSQAEMFDAVVQYVWVHSADLSKVMALETVDQIPAAELRKIGFCLSIGEAFQFLFNYQECALRMAANLTETEPEDDDGKPGKLPTLPVGSPASSMSAEPAEILSGSDTSSGSCQSSERSPIFTLLTLPTGPDADGQSLISESPEPEQGSTTPQS